MPPLPLGHPPSPQWTRLGLVKVGLLASIAAAAADRVQEGAVMQEADLPATNAFKGKGKKILI